MKDENRFRELMTVLGEIHDRQITRLLLDVYWRILEPFPDDACIRAFHELIGRVKFFPKPAEFLELLEARQGDQATSAWLDIVAALKRYGNYRSVRFADPVIHSAIEAMGGWVRLGLMEEKDRPWRQKEFERLWFQGAAFAEGVETHEVDGIPVRIYSPEKTLADCFKYRNKIGMDVVLEALKLYRQRRRFAPDELIRFARICRVEKIMRPYLEATL